MKAIKKVLFTTVSASLIVINSIAQWNAIDVPTKNHLNAIAFTEETTGWIVGNKGTMLYRSGNSWLEYPAITDEKLNSVCLLSKTEGWAVGARGTILHLKGSQWQKIESPTKEELHTVCFSNNGNGYAVGNNGTFLSYRNGIWEMTETRTPWHFYAIALNNGTPMIAGGRENLTVPIMDVGKPGTIFRKDWTGWQRIEIEGMLPALTNIFFTGKTEGITVGHGGTIMTYTNESGWQRDESPVNNKLNGSYIVGNKYYVVGNNGTVLVRTRNTIPPEGESSVSSPKLISTYPNPASDILNIIIPDMEIPSGTVTVLDSWGKVLFKKDFDYINEGFPDKIITTGFSDGLYIVNITSGARHVASGKFIVKR
jgi:photosystem II stability/assembly factor-like uncharacterized protein